MRHLKAISAARPARADELTTISAILSLLTSFVGALTQIVNLKNSLGSTTESA